MRASKAVDEGPLVEYVDLRPITRNATRTFCRVFIQKESWDRGNTIKWIELGEVGLCSVNDRHDGRFLLKARVKGGVTDFEHDTAYALQLPLIGVMFDGLMIHHSVTRLCAYINPNVDEDSFHVPPPGYDPSTLPGVHRCKDKQCLASDPKGHLIVPEDNWFPKFDANLFRRVAGKRVEIHIGSVIEEKDEDS
jgi:hypothetical protein